MNNPKEMTQCQKTVGAKSLNGFINATLAATIAQQETLTFFGDRLKDMDQATLTNAC
jgi:hypothetical protein